VLTRALKITKRVCNSIEVLTLDCPFCLRLLRSSLVIPVFQLPVGDSHVLETALVTSTKLSYVAPG